jgi:diaminopimelate decarboxylase
MATKNYNSFPEAAEVLIGLDGVPHLVRRRQTLEQVLQNELSLPDSVKAGAEQAQTAAVGA